VTILKSALLFQKTEPIRKEKENSGILLPDKNCPEYSFIKMLE